MNKHSAIQPKQKGSLAYFIKQYFSACESLDIIPFHQKDVPEIKLKVENFDASEISHNKKMFVVQETNFDKKHNFMVLIIGLYEPEQEIEDQFYTTSSHANSRKFKIDEDFGELNITEIQVISSKTILFYSPELIFKIYQDMGLERYEYNSYQKQMLILYRDDSNYSKTNQFMNIIGQKCSLYQGESFPHFKKIIKKVSKNSAIAIWFIGCSVSMYKMYQIFKQFQIKIHSPTQKLTTVIMKDQKEELQNLLRNEVNYENKNQKKNIAFEIDNNLKSKNIMEILYTIQFDDIDNAIKAFRKLLEINYKFISLTEFIQNQPEDRMKVYIRFYGSQKVQNSKKFTENILENHALIVFKKQFFGTDSSIYHKYQLFQSIQYFETSKNLISQSTTFILPTEMIDIKDIEQNYLFKLNSILNNYCYKIIKQGKLNYEIQFKNINDSSNFFECMMMSQFSVRANFGKKNDLFQKMPWININENEE